MLAEKFFKPSNMDLFRVANSIPDIFTQIEAAIVALTLDGEPALGLLLDRRGRPYKWLRRGDLMRAKVI